MIVLASIIGVWLFSVQHRFKEALWLRHGRWSAVSAALASTSHLRLPPVLRRFTGSIGLHHVHHLNPRVPNYRLQACHDALPALHEAPVLTLRSSLRALKFTLWDEHHGRMSTSRDAARRGADTPSPSVTRANGKTGALHGDPGGVI